MLTIACDNRGEAAQTLARLRREGIEPPHGGSIRVFWPFFGARNDPGVACYVVDREGMDKVKEWHPSGHDIAHPHEVLPVVTECTHGGDCQVLGHPGTVHGPEKPNVVQSAVEALQALIDAPVDDIREHLGAATVDTDAWDDMAETPDRIIGWLDSGWLDSVELTIRLPRHYLELKHFRARSSDVTDTQAVQDLAEYKSQFPNLSEVEAAALIAVRAAVIQRLKEDRANG